ncbi:TIGR02530 family flagellar biosynthesis protein [Ornatilinea apprima]|nr:TIGR02530 family flagellar biosynthesis protein [Ornatilinea apprima]
MSSETMRIQNGQSVYGPQNASKASSSPEEGQISFAETLARVQQGVQFTNHAQKRLEKRNIALNDDGIARLAQAVDKAEKRGGKESLVLMDDIAFLVNVKERLVITAVDQDHRGEGVFTQIDSVVFADPSEQINPDNQGTSKEIKA